MQRSRDPRSFEQALSFLRDRQLASEAAASLALPRHQPPQEKTIFRQASPWRDSDRGGSCFLLASLISSLASSSRPKMAVSAYKDLVGSGSFSPNNYTFPVILKSCARFSGLWEARQLHGLVTKSGFLSDGFVQNALVHVYGSCCEYVDAEEMFDEMPHRDVVSWTGLISGYVKGGLFEEAVSLFLRMDVAPNGATLVNMLVASGRLIEVALGRSVHGLILKREGEMGLIVGNALLDMYVKCGCPDEARQVFEELSCRDIISWTSVLSGLVQCGRPREALEVFHEMQAHGIEPDKVTLASVLCACASLGTSDVGRWVHDYIDRKGIEWDVHLGTAMVDMYAKVGRIGMAMQVFKSMPYRNISSWNALLGGLAMHGLGRSALTYYDQMISSGFVPNKVTFIAILNACSHSGLVEEGRHFFNSMSRIYNLEPSIEHYGCMVDMLGRAGLLDDAYHMIRGMPMKADVLIWGALLSACKYYGNVTLAEQAQCYVLDMEPSHSGVYVLLSNLYATNAEWRDVTKTRVLMKKMGIEKIPGSSVLELNGKSHEFLVGEYWVHPQKEEIVAVLNKLLNHSLFPEQLFWAA